jgi:GntR family transcriptional regulator
MGVDPHSSIPIYQQIVEHVRRAVAAGVYQAGEAIPSLRALAIELTVNPNTVQRAFEQLEREGLIQPRKGLGMFVTENGAASARSQSAAAVHASFVQGIRAGRAARLPAERIRGSFEQAWEDTQAEVRDDT